MYMFADIARGFDGIDESGDLDENDLNKDGLDESGDLDGCFNECIYMATITTYNFCWG